MPKFGNGPYNLGWTKSIASLKGALASAKAVPSVASAPAMIAPPAYATGQNYNYNQAVTNGGNVYRCVKPITTSATAPTGTSTVEVADSNGYWLFEDIARVTTSASAPTMTATSSNPITSPVTYDMSTSAGRAVVAAQGGFVGGNANGGMALYGTPALAASNGGTGPGGTTALYTFEGNFTKLSVGTFYGQFMRFWVDGVPLTYGSVATGTGTNPGWANLDFSSVGGMQRRKVRIEMNQGAPLFTLAVDQKAALWSAKGASTARAFVQGCSYELGVNGPDLSTPGRSWVTACFRDILGIDDAVGAGIGGSGYTTAGTWSPGGLPINRVYEIAQANPDIYVAGMWGINDPNTPSAITTAAAAFVQAVRAANPNLLIVALGVPPLNTDNLTNVKAREAAIQSAYVSAGAGVVNGGVPVAGNDPLMWFIPISGNLDGGPINSASLSQLYAHGTDIHPNDWGHQTLGWYIGRQISAILDRY